MKTKSVLIVGMGRFGRQIAATLNRLKHQVMAVDNKEERISQVLTYVTNAQIGDSTDEDFMRSLGVDNFDLCVVAIGDNFQSSLETTSLLKELGAKTVVSRAAGDVHEKFLLRNGADSVVYPEKQLAAWTAVRYSADNIFDYIELDENYSIFEIAVPKAWAGKSVGALNVRKRHGVNILAVRRGGKLVMSITPETKLNGDDTVLILGQTKDIQKLPGM